MRSAGGQMTTASPSAGAHVGPEAACRTERQLDWPFPEAWWLRLWRSLLGWPCWPPDARAAGSGSGSAVEVDRCQSGCVRGGTRIPSQLPSPLGEPTAGRRGRNRPPPRLTFLVAESCTIKHTSTARSSPSLWPRCARRAVQSWLRSAGVRLRRLPSQSLLSVKLYSAVADTL